MTSRAALTKRTLIALQQSTVKYLQHNNDYWAVRGAAVPASFALQFSHSDKCLTAGEIECYASHLLVAQQIVSRRLPYAIILEADAVRSSWRRWR